MLNTQKEIITECNDRNIRIYDIVIEEESTVMQVSEAKIRSKLDAVLDVMFNSAKAKLDKESFSKYDMIDSFAKKTYEYSQNTGENAPVCGKFMNEVMAMAFSTSEVNCSMGKIVAAPTAGSAGIMPAVMVAMKEKYDLDRTTLQNGLLSATGIGQIIAKYATFAGAEGGCQAECGAAASMGAAAIVEMLGGTPKQVLDAASFALVNVLGLVCDPIAGLVEYPCVFRNASGAINAMICADMALAGVSSVVPFDEVVEAMGEVGRHMIPELRETGLGGLAGTKTGCRIREDFLKNMKA